MPSAAVMGVRTAHSLPWGRAVDWHPPGTVGQPCVGGRCGFCPVAHSMCRCQDSCATRPGERIHFMDEDTRPPPHGCQTLARVLGKREPEWFRDRKEASRWGLLWLLCRRPRGYQHPCR